MSNTKFAGACLGIYFELQYKKKIAEHNSFIAPFFRARSDDQAIYRAHAYVSVAISQVSHRISKMQSSIDS